MNISALVWFLIGVLDILRIYFSSSFCSEVIAIRHIF